VKRITAREYSFTHHGVFLNPASAAPKAPLSLSHGRYERRSLLVTSNFGIEALIPLNKAASTNVGAPASTTT